MASRGVVAQLLKLARGRKVHSWRELGPFSVRFCSARSFSTAALNSLLAGKTHAELLELSVREPERFWDSAARERITWIRAFERVQDCDVARGKIGWFSGGKLNISEQPEVLWQGVVLRSPGEASSRWAGHRGDPKDGVGGGELLEMTCRLANVLKNCGVRKGDRVAIYMPMCPQAVAAMLACARMGAVHMVVFAGFSSEALADRIQDETGGVCIAPQPAEAGAEIRPTMAMRPFYGIQPALMDEKGQVLTGNDVTGALCISKPWPGMARSIFGDHQRFIDAYFKPYPGDGAHRTADGFYQITGRMDDVINVSGHRLGTAEIEDALDEHPNVPETAVIGIPHDVKGEVPFAFVVMKEKVSEDQESVVKELRQLVATKIAKYAVPEHFLVVKRLPKTRSGKIMRRILRTVSGMVTTLDDPSVVSEIIQAHQHYRNQAAKA
ncbi:Acetyl-coenzyme A synthetase 2-like, mitochondrial [Bagarius yarrelli]|uniref:Propionate--CoA ligase n=1 Tax=Bagarius yarrelli TaxID=175774 RepID=A0A556VWV9_BAGYA|nr:Acetyl-coenzyme A synthetase 2-like, mitochondrial [Bagarius yarrelli]